MGNASLCIAWTVLVHSMRIQTNHACNTIEQRTSNNARKGCVSALQCLCFQLLQQKQQSSETVLILWMDEYIKDSSMSKVYSSIIKLHTYSE